MTTNPSSLPIRLTETERRYGRLMRSPDGHDPVVADPPVADPVAADPPADPAPVDPPADPQATVLGGATDPAPADPPADPPAADPVVPEAYDLKLTVKGEDGTDSEVAIDTQLLETATPILKELGLNNEQANKVAALVPKVQERLLQQQTDAFAETRAQWAKDAQADPEIGGKNWTSTQTLAAKALDHFFGPATDDKGNKNAFRQLLDETGLGNHPAMIGGFRKVGAALAEDGTLPRGSEGPRAKPDRLEALYPNDVKK